MKLLNVLIKEAVPTHKLLFLCAPMAHAKGDIRTTGTVADKPGVPPTGTSDL